jgi:hypothetical protein
MSDGPRTGGIGVEELVRAALADPRRRLDPPAGYQRRVEEKVREVRRRRTFRSVGVLAGVVVLLAAGGLVANHRPAGVPTVPAGSPAPYGTQSGPLIVGAGVPRALVACGGSFCLAESAPDMLLRLDPVSLAVTASVPVPGEPEGIVADPTGPVWVWFASPSGALWVQEYESGHLSRLRQTSVAASEIFAGTAMGGDLWLTTNNGLLHLGASDSEARSVPGLDHQVYGLTADPRRNRILVDEAVDDGIRPVAVGPSLSTGARGATIPVGKEEIVAIGDRIWVGGFGPAGSRRLVRLAPDTLRPVAGSPVDEWVGPGAVLWAGASVLWVGDGVDEGLACVDPDTGAMLRQWRWMPGPVASVPGSAVAVDGPSLVKLVLGGACGG